MAFNEPPGGMYHSLLDPYGLAKRSTAPMDESLANRSATENLLQLQEHQMQQGSDIQRLLIRGLDRVVVDAGCDYRLLHSLVAGLEAGRNTITDTNC